MLTRRFVLSMVAVVGLVLFSAGAAQACFFGGCGGDCGCGGGLFGGLFHHGCCSNDCGCGCGGDHGDCGCGGDHSDCGCGGGEAHEGEAAKPMEQKTENNAAPPAAAPKK